MMQDIATALYCAWILSRPKAVLSDEIPFQDLDGPLEEVVRQGAFAPWVDQLHFVNARVGRVCVEIPRIRSAGAFACFSHTMGPSVVQALLKRLGLEEEAVTRWGKQLRLALHQRARQAL